MSDTPAAPPDPATPPLAMPELVPPEPPKPAAPKPPAPADKGRSPIVLGLVVMAACALGMGAAALISAALDRQEDGCAKLCQYADVPQVWANAKFQSDLAAGHCTCAKTAAKPIAAPPVPPVPPAPVPAG
jgi:hypothetical protein